MRKLILVVLMGWLVVPGAQAQLMGASAVYLGGTLPGVRRGTSGTLDLTAPKEIVFQSGESRIAMPYAGIQSYEYTRKLARRIGIIPTIAVVAVVKHRQRRHFITISFKDSQETVQTAVLEISKQMPDILLPVLDARAPKSSSKTVNVRRHLLH